MAISKRPLHRPALQELTLRTPEAMAADREQRLALELDRTSRHERKVAHLTQIQLAVKAGIDQADVSRLETGQGCEAPPLVLLNESLMRSDGTWSFNLSIPLVRPTALESLCPLETASGCNPWERLCALAVDRDALDDTFEDWERGALAVIGRLTAAGRQIRRIPIDVEALAFWCLQEGRQLNGAARAAHVTHLLERETPPLP